jgi:beta-lactamase regulating signal transducer with metallopeptidase domain
MAWTLAVSLLLAVGAALVARIASHFGHGRRFVWTVTMLVAAGAPVLLPPRALSLPWRSSPPLSSLGERAAAPGTQGPALAASSAIADRSSVDWVALARRTDAWIALAWAAWSSVLLLSLARAVAQLRRRSASWTTTDTEVGTVFVATADGPAVVGWLHPRIVVPSWALTEDAPARALILRHELEHLRSGDTRLLLLSELVRRVFPWNAVLWWMAYRLRLAVEMDCDARVVGESGTAHAYGRLLLALSERLENERLGEVPLATSPLTTRFDLEHRLRALGAERRRRPVVASIPYAVIALVVLTTAAWTPRPGFPARVRMTAAVDSDLVRIGYVQRKQTATGVFLDSSDIDRQARRFSDAFRSVPGLTVSPSGDGRTNVIMTADAGAGCVSAYVDGVPWQPSAPGDIDDFVNPAKLIAAELYQPSNRPGQFVHPDGPRCASLVVWTSAIRRRR